jgi:hypothetical protein
MIYLYLKLILQFVTVTCGMSNKQTTKYFIIPRHYTVYKGSSPATPVFSTNKTDRHDITEILLKVALNTITITFSLPFSVTVHLPGELISIIAIDSLSLSDNSQLVRLDMVISSSLEFYKYTVFYLGM